MRPVRRSRTLQSLCRPIILDRRCVVCTDPVSRATHARPHAMRPYCHYVIYPNLLCDSPRNVSFVERPPAILVDVRQDEDRSAADLAVGHEAGPLAAIDDSGEPTGQDPLQRAFA